MRPVMPVSRRKTGTHRAIAFRPRRRFLPLRHHPQQPPRLSLQIIQGQIQRQHPAAQARRIVGFAHGFRRDLRSLAGVRIVEISNPRPRPPTWLAALIGQFGNKLPLVEQPKTRWIVARLPRPCPVCRLARGQTARVSAAGQCAATRTGSDVWQRIRLATEPAQ